MKKAAIILGILLLVLVLVKWNEKRSGDRSFRKYLVEFDSASVDGFEIKTKGASSAVILKKENNNWLTEVNGTWVDAEAGIPEEAIKQLYKVQPKSVAASDKEQWNAYEITDSAATCIVMKSKGKKLASLYTGKFSFDQQRRTMTSYVRVDNDPLVYGVEGWLSMLFNRGNETFRNSQIVSGDSKNWKKMVFSYPADSSFNLSNQNGQWLVNGVMADSAKTAQFLSSIGNLTGRSFADNNALPEGRKADFTLNISGDNMSPLVIEGFLTPDNQCLIRSSANKGNLFTDAEVRNKLFVGREMFQ